MENKNTNLETKKKSIINTPGDWACIFEEKRNMGLGLCFLGRGEAEMVEGVDSPLASSKKNKDVFNNAHMSNNRPRTFMSCSLNRREREREREREICPLL